MREVESKTAAKELDKIANILVRIFLSMSFPDFLVNMMLWS